jgi:hypothetical protein
MRNAARLHAAAPGGGAHHFEAAQLLGVRVGVRAVRHEAGVVPMDDVVYAVLLEELLNELGAQVVRDAFGGLCACYVMCTCVCVCGVCMCMCMCVCVCVCTYVWGGG